MAERLLPGSVGISNFVNADYIAKGLSPHAPDSSAFSVGRIMLRRIRAFRDEGVSFAFESTLASKTFASFLHEAQARGYLVHLIYVSLSNQDLAVRRVALRVQRGGHDIPEATIRRRYVRSLANFYRLYQPLADSWSMWDNSGEGPVAVARGILGRDMSIQDPGKWERARQQGKFDER